jgi:hypothetical protein
VDLISGQRNVGIDVRLTPKKEEKEDAVVFERPDSRTGNFPPGELVWDVFISDFCNHHIICQFQLASHFNVNVLCYRKRPFPRSQAGARVEVAKAKAKAKATCIFT